MADEIKSQGQKGLTGFPEGRAKNGTWLSFIILKSSLAGSRYPRVGAYSPDAPMDFTGLDELSVLAFAPSE
jgi:hypothetical protein